MRLPRRLWLLAMTKSMVQMFVGDLNFAATMRKEDLVMSFRKLRGVDLTHREQGLIHFICLNYDKQPKEIQEKIRRLCRECGGEHEQALFALMTRENISVPWLEREYHVDDSTLYRRRKLFYERW